VSALPGLGPLSAAVLSGDGLYRYLLTRSWGHGRHMTFVMLNPSTADATADDPTIRRCVGFAKREHCVGITVVNLWALRSPNPDDLIDSAQAGIDPCGPLNAGEVELAITEAKGPVVCAWGATVAKLTKAGLHPLDVPALAGDTPLWCLGTTKDGLPRHPLYVKADARLVPFGAES